MIDLLYWYATSERGTITRYPGEGHLVLPDDRDRALCGKSLADRRGKVQRITNPGTRLCAGCKAERKRMLGRKPARVRKWEEWEEKLKAWNEANEQ